jgi:hypothetical protein
MLLCVVEQMIKDNPDLAKAIKRIVGKKRTIISINKA